MSLNPQSANYMSRSDKAVLSSHAAFAVIMSDAGLPAHTTQQYNSGQCSTLVKERGFKKEGK